MGILRESEKGREWINICCQNTDNVLSIIQCLYYLWELNVDNSSFSSFKNLCVLKISNNEFIRLTIKGELQILDIKEQSQFRTLFLLDDCSIAEIRQKLNIDISHDFWKKFHFRKQKLARKLKQREEDNIPYLEFYLSLQIFYLLEPFMIDLTRIVNQFGVIDNELFECLGAFNGGHLQVQWDKKYHIVFVLSHCFDERIPVQVYIHHGNQSFYLPDLYSVVNYQEDTLKLFYIL